MSEHEQEDLKQDLEFLNQAHYSLDDFRRLIQFLASDLGCPWDRVQTPKTLQHHLLEEAYEAFDAIEAGDETALKEELGDVLLQIVFQANLAKTFDLQDVVDGISRKMIDRHTHVFGDIDVADASNVLDIWERNKRVEKAQATHTDALLAVARALPALTRAHKIQAKAAMAGFDWPTLEGPRTKITEELEEAEAVHQSLGEAKMDEKASLKEELEMEVGDLLFAIVNWSRHVGVNPELALERSNQKFIDRFTRVEEQVQDQGLKMLDLSLEELDRFWDLAKLKEQEEISDEN